MARMLAATVLAGSMALLCTPMAAAQTTQPAPHGYFKGDKYYAPRGETMEQCRKRHLDRGARSMRAITRACERTTKKK